MATVLINLNKPATPTTTAAEMMTESSSASPKEQHQQHHLSSSSSTVSQSPIPEDNNGNLNADHSCSNDAATSIIQQRSNDNATSSSAIRNPYKKQSTSNRQEDQGSNVSKRRQFMEKYRLQALHHTHNHSRQHQQQRGVTVSKVVSSRSALEIMRLNQQWRQTWRRGGQSQYDQQSDVLIDNGSSSGKRKVALRPRLFLFQQLMQQQQRTTSQQHQQQGVWELGTGINEVSGEGGSGKTQICLSLCITCALTPLLFAASTDNSSRHTTNSDDPLYYTSIYITMGEGIPQSKIATRLHQMLGHRRIPPTNKHNSTNPENDDDEVERILSRIWLLSLKNEDDFIEFVEIHLPNILNNQSHGIKPQQQQSLPNNQYPTSDKIGFIAFDGIANFFRFSDPLFQQFQSSSATVYNQRSMFHQTRSSKLFQLSSSLRKISDVYNVPIVITNQVTTSVPSDDGLLKRQLPLMPPHSASMLGGGGQVGMHQIQPALGLIWSNCVTTRFILQRKDGLMAKISTGGNDDNGESKEEGTATTTTTRMQKVRKARVLQSVCTPEESEVWYFIDTGAVVVVS